VVHSGKIVIKSDAVIKILVALGGMFKAAIILKLIPSYLRNLLYDSIALRRYTWFGIRDTCRIPSSEESGKFLE
jgi:predicted DCC family thiol-disulfide oxidoreductase YuxK